MSTWLLDAAYLHTTALPGLSGAMVETKRELNEPVSASHRHQRLRSIARHAGGANLTTTGIKTLLSNMPQGSGATALPYPCASIASFASGITLWAVQQDDILPQIAAGSVHEKMVITKGLISLLGWQWGGVGQSVSAQARITPLSSDGTAAYWAKTGALAAPAAPPAETDFEVTSITWKGVAIPEVTRVEAAVDAPLQLFYPVQKIYPTRLVGAPAAGLIGHRVSLQVPDATLLRSMGENLDGPGDLIIGMTNFAQASATRGAETVSWALRATAEIETDERGRPNSSAMVFRGIQDSAALPLIYGVT